MVEGANKDFDSETLQLAYAPKDLFNAPLVSRLLTTIASGLACNPTSTALLSQIGSPASSVLLLARQLHTPVASTSFDGVVGVDGPRGSKTGSAQAVGRNRE